MITCSISGDGKPCGQPVIADVLIAAPGTLDIETRWGVCMTHLTSLLVAGSVDYDAARTTLQGVTEHAVNDFARHLGIDGETGK